MKWLKLARFLLFSWLSGCAGVGTILKGAGDGLAHKEQVLCHTKTFANGDSETHCERN